MRSIFFYIALLICFVHCKHSTTQTDGLNSSLISELDLIYKSDQLYRSNFDSLNTLAPEEFQKAMLKMDSIDQSNARRIAEIIDEYNWPGKSVVGDRGNRTIFLVIQHSDIETQLKYLPLFKESVEKGESRKEDFAFLQDRTLLRSGQKQIYGTQLKMDHNTQEYYLDMLEDPDNVDKRRQEIGLIPISEYLKKGWDLDWDVEQFKIEQENRELNKTSDH